MHLDTIPAPSTEQGPLHRAVRSRILTLLDASVADRTRAEAVDRTAA